jgi:hypothetical protein
MDALDGCLKQIKEGEVKMFNEENFVKEFTDFVKSLDVSTAMEIGCQSGELLSPLFDAGIETSGIDIYPKIDGVVQADIREFKDKKKYDLVFSSGLLEHFPIEEIPDIIKKMATLSKNYVLNYVPNSGCIAYMNNKATTSAEWKDELAFTIDELEKLHKDAGLEVVKSGMTGGEWAKKFGNEPSEPYLVWVLAKKPTNEKSVDKKPVNEKPSKKSKKTKEV